MHDALKHNLDPVGVPQPSVDKTDASIDIKKAAGWYAACAFALAQYCSKLFASCSEAATEAIHFRTAFFTYAKALRKQDAVKGMSVLSANHVLRSKPVRLVDSKFYPDAIITPLGLRLRREKLRAAGRELHGQGR